jgi:plastocyanin
VGDSVCAHNADGTTHTFTGPSWDSGDMGPGAVRSLRFDTAGTFDFYCTPHQAIGMTGTLTVR